GGMKLDRPARERVVAFLEEDREALLHLQPAGGERPGLDGQKPDAQRRGLRHRRRHLEHLPRHAGRARSPDHATAIDGHAVAPCFFQTTTPRLPRARNCDHASRLDVLPARPGLAIVDRMLEELARVIGPELADVGIGLDHGVDELAALLLHLADVDVADHVAVLVEAHRPAASWYF